MDNGIHFISGLPRSGSTLLGAILRQNPKFHAGMSSPVAPMFGGLQNMLSGRNEFHVFIDDKKRSAILRGIFHSYYEELHRSKVIFDTNRSWCSKLPALVSLFPNARIICCVRSVAWILDSFERIVRSNALEPSRMFNYEAGGNVYTRTETMLANGGVVGAAYSALKDAFYGELSDRLLLIRYESLTQNPLRTMASVYDFIDEEPYEHDFEHVEFDADDYDFRLGTRGLHHVHPKVQYKERVSILPPDIVQKHAQSEFWSLPDQNPRGVWVI